MSKKKSKFSILISQPEPDPRSPYLGIAKKYKVDITFRPFIELEDCTKKEFRKQRININHYPAVVFNSRIAMEQYFRIIEEMRATVSQETKYFCKSEAIALYLQKFIQYRKRKVFYGNGTMKDFETLLLKYRSTGKFLYPCAEDRKNDIPSFLQSNDFDFKEGHLYRTVAADLSDLDLNSFNLLLFFSPKSIESLFKSFPNFKQKDVAIGAFGESTKQSIEAKKLKLNIEVPSPKVKSMSNGLEIYLNEHL